MITMLNDTITIDEKNIYYLIKDYERSIRLSIQFHDFDNMRSWEDKLNYAKDYFDFAFYPGYTADVQKRIINDGQRSKRLRNRIKHLYKDFPFSYFLTYSFTEDDLIKLNADSRKQAATRFVKSHFTSYVGNIDFGSLHQREHYHFVCASTEKVDYTNFPSPVDVLPITYGNQYILGDYVEKFAQHAEKIKQRYIYSRG